MIDTTVQTIDLVAMGKRAKAASRDLAKATTVEKNAALLTIAKALELNTDAILAANRLDLEDAQDNGVDPLYIRDRLAMEQRMVGMIADVRKVAELPDPVGR
ncbi:MAG: gamma-glutamyl-phosphate reductase, partial [Phototrophicales bacterium]